MEPILFRRLGAAVIWLILMPLGFNRPLGGEAWITTVAQETPAQSSWPCTAEEAEEGGLISIRKSESEQITTTETAIAHNFVLAVARRNDEVWVGMEMGLSLGLPLSRSADDWPEYDYRGGQ